MSKLKIVPTAAAFAASRSLFPGLAQWAKNGENVAIISATCSMSCCMNFLFEMFSSLQSPNVFAYHSKNFFLKKKMMLQPLSTTVLSQCRLGPCEMGHKIG